MRLLFFNLATDSTDTVLAFSCRWISALAAAVESVDVITMRGGPAALPGNVRVHSVGKEKGYSEPRRVVEFYRILLSILGERKVDGCFSHMMPLFSAMAGPILRARGIPLVTWYAHPSLTNTLRAAHLFSNRMVASVAEAYPYSRGKLSAIGQAIDTDLFSPDPTEEEQPPLILCAGRLSPVKDHPTLLRACARLKYGGRPRFRVVILGKPVGPGAEEYRARLVRLAEDLGLRSELTLAPEVMLEELPPWYRRCTVHVNLTPMGFGDKVAWEAMACGRPCVLANEGFRETLGRHADELLFAHGNAEQLASRLDWVLSRPAADRARIGDDLRRQVIRRHSLSTLPRRILTVFDELKGASR